MPDGAARGLTVALIAALLFGLTTPLASVLAHALSPLWLSAALYIGVAGLFLFRRTSARPVLRGDLPWLAGSALIGGVAAPVLLVTGLRLTDAASASLLLAMEPVATALIAWFVVREHAARRTVAGMALISAGALLLAWRGSPSASLGSIAVVGAALCWGIDNNLAQRIASSNAVTISGLKGLVAGSVSTGLALALHDPLPAPGPFAAAIALGTIGYGLSLVLFMRALRAVGTARASACLATAPFAGAAGSLALGRPPDALRLGVAGALMAAGVVLHVTERHEHPHQHPATEHEHFHEHDEHHAHEHPDGIAARAGHAHAHSHAALTHVHPHAPDAEHRHSHPV